MKSVEKKNLKERKKRVKWTQIAVKFSMKMESIEDEISIDCDCII